ncbi:MAG TPA: rhomboid family intramembrane serine protease [Deltaproteobacteria bacterium]|nr:rhomboid family intramembrane serine protease [Deltaproteobacteria bacterium]
MTRQVQGALQSARSGAGTLAASVSILWAVHLVNTLLGGVLIGFGIVPRTASGLYGILLAPFLHGSWSHLVLNSVSLVLLGAITMTRRRVDFYVVSVFGALASGLGTWLIGAPGSVHVGASGVIFAYLGFLMARGFFERSASSIVLSALVTWFFGSMVWGVLPTVGPGISWEAHLFGFLGGVGAARLLGNRIRGKG